MEDQVNKTKAQPTMKWNESVAAENSTVPYLKRATLQSYH